MRMRRRAVRAMLTHTSHSIRDLRNDEDEMLRGMCTRSACSASQSQPMCAARRLVSCRRDAYFLGTSNLTLDCTCEICHYIGKRRCMLGVDWGGVEKYVDLTDCYLHYLDPCYVPPKVRVWYLPWTWCYKAQRYAPRTDIFCLIIFC